jgi:nicotinic acid mononucleotide adenylyltransferase
MAKTIIYPGSFDPIHVHHMLGLSYFGKKYKMDRGILLPSCDHPEKGNGENFWERIAIMETWLTEDPLPFPVGISNDEYATRSTGASILNVVEQCRQSGSTNEYLLLGLDTLGKFQQFDDYRRILDVLSLVVNDYDGNVTVFRPGANETVIQTKAVGGDIVLPTGRVILDRNPYNGLHSTDIRENPGAFLHIFPNKTRTLIEKLYC